MAVLLIVPLIALIVGPPEGLAADDPMVPRAAPMIQTTTPSDGQLDVSLSGFIEVRFSEAMNQSSVLNATQPSLSVTESWPQPNTLRLTAVSGFAPCTAYDVQIAASDADEGLSLIAGPVPNPWSFMTACASPFIVATNPRHQDRNVPAGIDIVVTFSERMNVTKIFTFTLNPSPPGWTHWWSQNSTRLTINPDLTSGTTYTAVISQIEDVDGNLLVDGIVPNPWTFSVNALPTVSAPSPSRSGCLDAGGSLLISWTMSDDLTPPEDLTVTLSYQNASGRQPIVGPAQNFPSFASYLWTLPAENVETNVSIEVRDSADGIAWNRSAEIRIDTGAPSVLSTFPADGATDVHYRDPGWILITFSEAMDPSTVLVVIEPDLVGAPYVWLPDYSQLQIRTGFADRQLYNVTIRGTARDTCGAGHPLGADERFSFTTSFAPPQPPGGLIWTDRQETSLTIEWDAVVAYATNRPIPLGTVVSYRVERDGVLVGTTNSTHFTDRGLRPETEHVYRVWAFANGLPSTSSSAALTAKTLPPFFTTFPGRLVLGALSGATIGGILVWAQLRVRRGRDVSRSRLQAEAREVVDLIRKTRSESDPGKRRSLEGQLQGRFLALVAAPNERGETLDPRLDLLYRALAEALVHSPEVDVAHGRSLADARLGNLRPALAAQGAAYRLLSEAEASVSSDLFRGLPESGRKALFLVYFYSLEEYLSNRLRILVPPGATVLLGDRGHINVRRRGWEQQWAGLSLGNLLYLLDHNRQMFLSDEERWEEDVEPFVHQTVDARNRTAHPSREAPPLDRVRELIYTSLRLLESVLKAPKGAAA